MSIFHPPLFFFFDHDLRLRSYLVKRVIYTIVLIVFVIVLNWIIFEAMPGQVGALYSCLGQVKLSPTFCDNQLKLFGYGQSPWVKFVDYFKAMVTFNFGYSYQYNAPVTTLMINQGRLANTLLLLGASTVFSIVIGTDSHPDAISIPSSSHTYTFLIRWISTTDPGYDGRGSQRGLHLDGTCKRSERKSGTFQTRVQERIASDNNFFRACVRWHTQRRHHHRNNIQLEWAWTMALFFHPVQGLPCHGSNVLHYRVVRHSRKLC